jgi:anti-sigma28 factor (negative regulator of flagellin synthesis)
MRVQDNSNMGPVAPETSRARETPKVDTAGSAPSSTTDSAGDHVEFSSTLGRLSQAISTDSAQRAGRVQTLAVAYQAGQYRVDSQATSQGMIAEAVAASHE